MTRWPRAHVAAATVLAALLIAVAASSRVRAGARHHAAYVGVGDLRLRFVRAGRGTPVVLLHGYGESLLAWRGVFDQLARDNDVIALDLPGFGLSSKPRTGYSTDTLAAVVLEAMRKLGVARAVLVGHSMGGAVAAAAALAAPDRVPALVLVDAAVVGTPAALPDARLGSSAAGATRKAVTAYEAIRTRFNAPHDPHWLIESDSALAYLPADDDAYRSALAAVLREFDFSYLTPERARSLRTPTLVIWGEYDQVFSESMGRAVAAVLPNARFEVITRSWHRPHEERPDETAAVILAFLASERAKSTSTP